MSNNLKKQEQTYQEKLNNNEQLSLADLGDHNEYIMEHRNLKFGTPYDVARILNPKKMPTPRGKVYKG